MFTRVALWLILAAVICLAVVGMIPLVGGAVAETALLKNITWPDVTEFLKASGLLVVAGGVVVVAWVALRGVMGSLFLTLAVLCFKDGRADALRLLHQSPPRDPMS